MGSFLSRHGGCNPIGRITGEPTGRVSLHRPIEGRFRLVQGSNEVYNSAHNMAQNYMIIDGAPGSASLQLKTGSRQISAPVGAFCAGGVPFGLLKERDL